MFAHKTLCRLTGDDPNSTYNLALCLIEMGEHKRAIRSLVAVAEADPHNLSRLIDVVSVRVCVLVCVNLLL